MTLVIEASWTVPSTRPSVSLNGQRAKCNSRKETTPGTRCRCDRGSLGHRRGGADRPDLRIGRCIPSLQQHRPLAAS